MSYQGPMGVIPEGVTDLMAETLQNYWNHGYEPGGFTTAVLCNDLFGAAARADHWNRRNMAAIAEYIVNNAPYGSYGNAELVKDWLNKGHYFEAYQKQRVIDILSEREEEEYE